jgi:ribonuclease P protein component
VDSVKEGFKREQRLRQSKQYEHTYKNGARVQTSFFVLYGTLNQEDFHRLGLTVSRKIGKAVIRNKIKRRIREIFRRYVEKDLAPMDLVLNVKKAIRFCPFEVLKEDVVRGSMRMNQVLVRKKI